MSDKYVCEYCGGEKEENQYACWDCFNSKPISPLAEFSQGKGRPMTSEEQRVKEVCQEIEDEARKKGGALFTLSEKILLMAIARQIVVLEQRIAELERTTDKNG